MNGIQYRLLTHPDELIGIAQLEARVWGVSDLDIIPLNLIALAAHNGGCVHAAELNGVLIGGALAYPARRYGEWVLWSHFAAVDKPYQGMNIGYQLKHIQRQWAAQNGYDKVAWTFDPLQARNANFNLNRIDAIGVAYHENFYGIMNDNINVHALPSDRLEMHWNTHEPAPPLRADAPLEIKIPPEVNRKNQQTLQEAFSKAFEAGYLLRGFDKSTQSYLLYR